MKIFSVLLLSIFMGFCFWLNIYLPFIFLGLFVYGCLLFKRSEIALFITILVIFSCFSMMNPDFLRMPYIFRIRDIFFLSIFLPLLGGIYRREKKIGYIFSSPIAKGIYLILFLSLVQLIITKLRFPDETLNSIIRMGRRYFYYALFFPALYILLDEIRYKRFVKLFLTAATAFSLLYILQFLIGPSHNLFLWGRVEYQTLQGFRVVRMYVLGVITVTLIFHISFMLFLFHNKFKYRLKNIFLLVISGLQTIITFGRAHIFGVATGTVFGIICAKRQRKLEGLIKIVAISFVIIIFVEGGYKVLFPRKKSPLVAISSRVASTYTAIVRKEGTFYFRIKDSIGRVQLIKNNPILGVGFVHDESRLFAFERGYNRALRTTDSGIVTLLLDFGILGLIWLFAMAAIVLKRVLCVYNTTDNPFYRSVLLGVLAFYFGRLFSFITLADFVLYDGIVTIALSLVLPEVLNYRISTGEVSYEGDINNNSQL